MSEFRVPPGRVKKLSNGGWSVRWSPTSSVTKKALFVAITDDNVLELEHIRTFRTSCRESDAGVDPDPDPCDVPEAFLAILRDQGCKPVHVRPQQTLTTGVSFRDLR